MILAGTGHRPNKLGGYSPEVFARLVSLAEAALIKYQPTQVISGMALGWDQALAQASINLHIPLLAAVPFLGQESQWPEQSQAVYRTLLAQAAVHIVSPGGYVPRKMQVRNEWMVDLSTDVLALWNGSSGGTGNAIQYARKQGKPIINLWSSWAKYAFPSVGRV